MKDAARKGRLWAWNAGVTHCKRGHEYTSENTILRSDPRAPGRTLRRCRECARACSRAWKERVGYRSVRKVAA